MGGATSSLTPEDIEELQSDVSGFTAAEIKKLYKRFHHLDRSHCGFLTQHEMQLIPELSLNPLCNRVIELFDEGQRNQINFRDFVRTLWIFSPRSPDELKLKSAFKVFDVDDDGQISEQDLYNVMQIMVGKTFPSQKLSQIVEDLIQSAQIHDEENDNEDERQPRSYLTYEELTKSIGEREIIEKMTIPFTFSK